MLTARAGMWTPQEFRDALAMTAANHERNRAGFQWRTLEDTTSDATAAHRSSLPYRIWQMSEEYCSGGPMTWLEVDARLRALTHDQKSPDQGELRSVPVAYHDGLQYPHLVRRIA